MENLMTLKKSPSMLLAPVLAVVLGFAAYGFTASNTVPGTKAGDGAGAISGYTVSNVSYGLNSSNSANLDSVSFTVSSAPAAGSTMKIKLVAAGSTWYTCTNVTTTLTCDTTSPQATVSAADELRVLIVN